MKVLYHSDAFVSKSRYGLSRVAWELYESLMKLSPKLELIPFSSRCGVEGSQLEELLNEYGYIRPKWKHRNLVLSWAITGHPRIERWQPDVDLVHTVEMDYPVSTKKPWVVTVHDLGPLTHPEYFSKSRPWLRSAGINSAIKHADIIVSVSSATAEAIETIAGHSLGDRIRIIPEGVSEIFFKKSGLICLATLEGLPANNEPFFLWTGSLNPRKNLGNVLDAYESITEQVPHHLVLAGGLGWDNHELLERITGSRFCDRIHRPGFVTDDQLIALYQSASAFIYVSFMEGFGLPILEAMACECPVITSNISSMPEVAGENAILVDPGNVNEIADAMQTLASDKTLSGHLSRTGLDRARQFTWDTCANKMINIYNEIV